eukprot:6471181-Amphidinium_carterae.1
MVSSPQSTELHVCTPLAVRLCLGFLVPVEVREIHLDGGTMLEWPRGSGKLNKLAIGSAWDNFATGASGSCRRIARGLLAATLELAEGFGLATSAAAHAIAVH